MINQKRIRSYKDKLYLKIPKGSNRDVISQNVLTDVSEGTTKLSSLSTNFPLFYNSISGVGNGVEIISNGTFDVDEYWFRGGTWDINDTFPGKAYHNADYGSMIRQMNLNIVLGTYYVIEFDISNSSSSPQMAIVDNNTVDIFDVMNLYTDITDGHYYFISQAQINATSLYIWGNHTGSFALDNFSVQPLIPASACHSFIWTPGVDYTEWTSVKSIMGSNINSFLRVNDTGGMVLDDGVNEVTLNINFLAGVSYLIKIPYGFNEALGDYKMELSVFIDGNWVSSIGDFRGSFIPSFDFIYGLDNTYGSVITNHIVEKLKQSDWKPTETIPEGYSILTSDGEVLTSSGYEVTSNNASIYAID